MKALPPPEARDLERLRYWQGQMLRSRDFRDQVAVDAQLRWWHNRAMHHAFGIARGFKTHKEPNQTVNIKPGIAYDCFGREIILRKEQRVKIPTLEEPVTLLVCYGDTATNCEVKQACLPGRCSAFKERPKFVWKPASCVEPQDGVPLGTLSNDDWQTYTRTARALSRPRIASGATIAGATHWEIWSAPFSYGTPITFQVTIDTSAAGFTEVPYYFARLQGDLSRFDANENILGVEFDYIDDLTRSSFTFRSITLIGDRSGVKSFQQLKGQAAVNFLQKRKFYVSWLGIQPGR
jgi:hypothetical protein